MNSELQEWLECVVERDDVKGFENVNQSVLDGIISYLNNVIPTKIFTSSSAEDIEILQSYTTLLNDKFLSKGKIPFTMRRICELIYHPLNYYHINELNKFNNAISKCINIESEYDFTVLNTMQLLLQQNKNNLESSLLSNNVTGEDVSMSKIPFLPSSDDELKIRKEYNEFLREIDSVMSINYEYDEGEEDDDDDDYIGHEEIDEHDDDYVEEEEEDDNDEE